MTSEDSEVTKNRISALTCRFCNVKSVSETNTEQQSATEKSPQQDDGCEVAKDVSEAHEESNDIVTKCEEPFWICEKCRSSEHAETKKLESALLVDGNCESTKETQAFSLTNNQNKGSKHEENDCACQACVERRELEEQQEQELHILQKSWVQLRHAVRQMYRDGFDKEGRTGKGKKFDLAKLKELVSRLCSRDPHQLYQRLESQGREYVMELKVNLLQVLVSPEKVGIQPSSNAADKSGTVPLTPDQAKYFLKATLDSFSQFQDTVRNMHMFMQDLRSLLKDRMHLEKFGITWKVVHHHLFDSVVYQDPLIQNSIPAMSAVLNVELTCTESEGGSPKKSKEDMKDLPQAAYELAQSFRALHRLMCTSRQIWDKASQRMEEYTAKQMKLYKATLKAKQKMLREDLEFFKQQRRLLEEYVVRSRGKEVELKKTNSEEDLAHFAETLRNFLSGSRPGRQHSATTIECLRCRQKHCPCDECAISHVITCGLVTDEDQELELPPSVLEELPMLGEMEDFDQSSYSTGTSSESDEDDSHSEGPTEKFDTAHLDTHIVCRKRTTIICSDGKKVTKASTAIIPSSLYSMRDHSQSDVQQHLYHAYGDWEVPWDPVARSIPGLPFDLYYRRNSVSSDRSSLSSGRSSSCQKEQNKHTKKENEDNDHQVKTTGTTTTTPKKQTTHDGLLEKEKQKAKPKESESKKSQGGQEKEQNGAEKPKTVSAQANSDTGGCGGQGHKTSGDCVAGKGKVQCDHSRQTGRGGGKLHGAKAYADLVKIFKEEGIAKALTIAAARKAKSGELKESDLDKIDWKDLNIDPEAVKKLCAQHMAVHGEPKPPTPKDPNAEKKEHTSVATQVDSFDEDEDSWSDRSSLSQKEGKHCDCCYCEMFGHGGMDFKNYGRDEYPQIRERLRLKLKQKNRENKNDCPSIERVENGNQEYSSVDKEEEKACSKGDKPLDELLEFINGPDPGKTPSCNNNGTVDGGTAASAKAAKRLRQKQKKAEDRLLKQQKEEQKKREMMLKKAAELEKQKREAEEMKILKQQKQNAKKSDVAAGSPKKKAKKKVADTNNGKVMKNSRVSVDEVFKPRDDLESLDEIDRDVENFKK